MLRRLSGRILSARFRVEDVAISSLGHAAVKVSSRAKLYGSD